MKHKKNASGKYLPVSRCFGDNMQFWKKWRKLHNLYSLIVMQTQHSISSQPATLWVVACLYDNDVICTVLCKAWQVFKLPGQSLSPFLCIIQSLERKEAVALGLQHWPLPASVSVRFRLLGPMFSFATVFADLLVSQSYVWILWEQNFIIFYSYTLSV